MFLREAVELARLTGIPRVSAGEVLPLHLILRAEPLIAQRKNMADVFSYVRSNPGDVVNLYDDLDQAVDLINVYSNGPEPDLICKEMWAIRNLGLQLPYPFLYANEIELEDRPKYDLAFAKALVLGNQYMKVREEVEDSNQLSAEIRENDQWLEFHLRAKTLRSRLAAMMVHGYDIFLNQYTEGAIKLEQGVNAICEAMAVYNPTSKLYEILKDPNDLDWYAPGYGMSDELLKLIGRI